MRNHTTSKQLSPLSKLARLGINAGKIAAISATPLAGRTVVDISRHVVAPGFIDLHAHGQTPGDMAIQISAIGATHG